MGAGPNTQPPSFPPQVSRPRTIAPPAPLEETIQRPRTIAPPAPPENLNAEPLIPPADGFTPRPRTIAPPAPPEQTFNLEQLRSQRRSAPIPAQEQIYNDLLAQSLINYNLQNQGLPAGEIGINGSPLPPAIDMANRPVPIVELPPPPAMQYMTNQQSDLPKQIPNLPTTATSQIPPVPPVELPSALPIQQPQARRVQPTFRDAMAMQAYNNFMQQQLNTLATNRINESMQMPAQQIPNSNKAAENYASLIPGQMNQQTNTTAPRIPTIPGMQQPSGFGSSQTENMPRQRQPRVGFGYLPKNEIAPVGY